MRQLVPRVNSQIFEVVLPKDGEIRWLLTQCSKSCSRLFFVLKGKRLEVVGQDLTEGFALRLGLSGLDINHRRASFCIRVDARELRAATSWLSGSSPVRLRFFRDHVEICSPSDEGTMFNVSATLSKAIPSARVSLSHRLVLSTGSLHVLTRASRAFPEIVKIGFSKESLRIFELPPSGKQLLSVSVKGGKEHRIEVVVASRYLRGISEILRKADAEDAIVSFDPDKPVRLAFRFSSSAFVVAVFPTNSPSTSKEDGSSSVQNLPQFKTCPMVQLISFIGSRADGIDPLMISRIGLDTPSSINLIEAQKLNLISWGNTSVMLTREGRNFLSLLRKDPPSAKTYLHETAMRMDPIYRKIMSILTTSPMPYEELKLIVGRSVHGPKLDSNIEETISLLTGIASWSRVVTRKVGLIYSLKNQQIANEGSEEIAA